MSLMLIKENRERRMNESQTDKQTYVNAFRPQIGLTVREREKKAD